MSVDVLHGQVVELDCIAPSSSGQALLQVSGITQGEWAAPTLLNSWVNLGTGSWAPCGYRRDSAHVELRGAVEDGTAGVIFTLPVGMRPAYDCSFAVPVHDNTSAPDYGHLIVRATGDVELEHPVTLSNHQVWLDGVRFALL